MTMPINKSLYMARIVSALTFPLLMPTYAVVIIFTLSDMNRYEPSVLWMVGIATFGITAFLPFAGILLLYKLGKISNPALNERGERHIPFIITILSYISLTIYFHTLPTPSWMQAFMLGAAVALAVAALINTKWKISGHAMGMGGLTALAFFLAFKGLLLSPGYAFPLVMILVSGLTATSRLLLKRHTLAQVGAGFAWGFVAIYISMII